MTNASSNAVGYIGYNVTQALPLVMDMYVTNWISGSSSGSWGETWWGAGNSFSNPVGGASYASLFLPNSANTSGGWKIIYGAGQVNASNPPTGILTEAISTTSYSLSYNYGTPNTISYAMTSPVIIGGQRQHGSPGGTWKFQYMRLRTLPPNGITPSVAFGSATSALTVTNHVSCNGGNNGSVSVSPVGGVSPYTYSWSSGETTSSIGSKTANTYSLTIQDNAGCSVTGSVTITQPASALATNLTITANVSCYGNNNGNAQSIPSGGTSPYTYAWSSGETTSGISSKTANTFTLTVQDNHGCSLTSSVTISQPNVLTSNSSIVTNAGCNGYSNGSAQSAPAGGTSPFTYAWSSGETTSSIVGKSANTYTLTVRDNNGCSATGSVTITQSSAVVANWWSIYNVSCFGGTNGKVISTVYGGTNPYSYLWTTGSTTGTASGLSANTNYTLTVTDKNGCTGTNSISLTQPAAVLSETIAFNSNLTCFGNKSGSATSNPTGGTSPYSYSWLPSGGTSQTSISLPSGNDNCKVTDAHGCTTTANVTLTQPAVISAIFTHIIPYCNGTSSGSITAAGKGGSGIYTGYTWAPYGGNSATAINLSAQTYTVTVTDNNGCTGTATNVLGEPSAVAVTVPTFTCVTGGKGTVVANVTGGTPAYHYIWSNGTSTVGILKTETLPNGSYTVTVFDSHNCPGAQTNVTISACPDVLPRNRDKGEGNNNGLTEISIYPNPSNGQFKCSITSEVSGITTIEAYSMLGQRVYAQPILDTYRFSIDLSNQVNGIYLIRILDKDGNLVGMKKVVKTN